MTTALFSKDGNAFAATVSGHAGYNPGGPDIVCAACSTLAYTLLQCVLAQEAEGAAIRLHTDVREADGYFDIGVQCESWALPRMEGMFDVIVSGFSLLESQYPEHVKVLAKNF